MKFRKGTKVEFIDQRQTPFVAWRTAEIISGNGHTYVLQYDQCPPHGHMVLEKVRRKAMRPCPPVGGGDWAIGHVVEFFNRGSWKPAEVRGAIGTDYYYVRLIGSSREFSARKSSLRSRQTWQDNKWVVVQKDTGKSRASLYFSLSDEGKPSYLLPNSCLDTLSSTKENRLVKNHVAAFGQPTGVISRCSKKRRFSATLSTYNCEEGSRKKRVLRKNGNHQDVPADLSIQLLDKVDAVVSPQKLLGEKYMHSSVKNRTAGFSKMESSKDISKFDNKYCCIASEPSDAESTSSSVGSCSIGSSPYGPSYNHVTSLHQEFCSHPDEADNSCSSRSESSFPIMESTQRQTHQLELHAYRSTLMALYASGPLSWEREILLTNLRLTLNISIDEHSLELKNLRCSELAFC